MESTRPIRALTRGLDALTVLNSHDGATVSEVAQEIRLPRTTVYRILETLCDAGFAFRDAADERYRIAKLVRSLSTGFEDEPWVAGIAQRSIDELGRSILWPLALATPYGTDMILRATTDHSSPLARERMSPGFRVPLLGSAAGRVFLAFCPDAERDTLLDLLARSNKQEAAQSHRAELLKVLTDIKACGYATAARTRRLEDEVSIAVPVRIHDRPAAVLGMRFLSSSVPLKLGLERFLPKLNQYAARIATSISEQQAAPRPTSATPAI